MRIQGKKVKRVENSITVELSEETTEEQNSRAVENEVTKADTSIHTVPSRQVLYSQRCKPYCSSNWIYCFKNGKSYRIPTVADRRFLHRHECEKCDISTRRFCFRYKRLKIDSLYE